MTGNKRNCHGVRGLRTFIRSAVIAYVVLALASCSGNGANGGNQNQAGSAGSTPGAAGPSNGVGGVQAISTSGGIELQGGAGGDKMTATSGVTGGAKAVAGASGKGGAKANAGDAGKGGSKASAGEGGRKADAGAPDVACNPADKTAAPTVASTLPAPTGAAPTGPYKVTVEVDPGLPTHTEYRPELKSGTKYSIIAWGNTGCSNNSLLFNEFLIEIASHGFLIIDAGLPDNWSTVSSDGVLHKAAIDWAFKENERPCSQYYHKLDTTKVAAMGQSCGGLMTYAAAGDPRLTTIIIWNSGLFSRDQAVYDSLHTPMAIFCGGSSDMAYANAEADFPAITAKIPIFYGNLDVGHMATYDQDNGGEFGRVGVAWLKWQLEGDEGPNAKGLFVGANCGLCDTEWVIKKKNME